MIIEIIYILSNDINERYLMVNEINSFENKEF